jgi:toxin ParE1/3/4
MKLVWTRLARDDRKAIREYIAADKPRAAIAWDERIAKAAEQLLDHPALGRPGRVTGTRELVAHPNYLLIYDTQAEHVRVLRVLHAARQWPERPLDWPV